MHFEQIEILLEKYYNGETSLEEENQLKQFFLQTKLLPGSLKPHAVQFQAFAQEQDVVLDKYLSEDWLFEKIEKPAGTFTSALAALKTSNSFKQYYWQLAAGISLLLTAFWGVTYFQQRGSMASGNPEVMALQQEVREMKQVLASTSSVNGASASDRIRVVSQEFNTQDFNSAENQEVTQLLTKTMTSDENVNVRLAACEALYQFKEEPNVRKAYIKALGQEKNPLMQLALIEVVTHLKETKALPQLQKLANQENILPIVKLKAQEGLGTFI